MLKVNNMRPKYYLLRNKQIIPTFSLQQFAMAFNFETDRRVRQTYLLDRWISTVFLGIDHGYGDKPILFETMVFEFGEMIDIDCARCSTYDEAIKMHYNMIVDHQIKSLRETAAYIGALCFALFSTIQITALASLI